MRSVKSTVVHFPARIAPFVAILLGGDTVLRMERIGAALIDIDGVLTVSFRPLPGTVEAMQRLRAAGLPLALVTNNTARTRAAIAAKLASVGYPVTAGDILTAPAVTAAYLREHHPGARCLFLNSGDVQDDLDGVTLVPEADDTAPDVVVFGGAGKEFTYACLNRAFRELQRGIPLIAMHRNLYWRTSGASTSTPGPSCSAWSEPPASRRQSPASPRRRSSPQRWHTSESPRPRP